LKEKGCEIRRRKIRNNNNNVQKNDKR